MAVVVVGAGAAGLWAAARLAQRGLDVTVLEKTGRTGTKILASGGTRCNLTTTLAPDEAARTFGKTGARFLRGPFRALPPQAVREHFAGIGVPTVDAPLDKVFPRSGRARDVRDALETWARAAGARIRLGAPVTAVERAGAQWRVRDRAGGRTTADALVLAAGGQSYPRTGTTGDGYRWLADLGLPLIERVPALVPLRSGAGWVRDLSGVTLPDAHLRLQVRPPDGAAVVVERRRPVLFTHSGLSGPGPMDVSEAVARGGGEMEARLDLAPDRDRDDLRRTLLEAAARPGAPQIVGTLSRWLDGAVPRRLVEHVVMCAIGRDDNPPVAAIDKKSRHRLIEAVKGLVVPIHGTLGWDKAEVTAGGLALKSVDPRSMQVRDCPGLFVIGELLDLQGPIGGLNFQAAFSCAEMAARAAPE